MSKVSDQTGIPRRTISQWSKTEWWDELCSQLRQQTEAEILARNEQIIREAQEQVLDRLEHGDHQLVKQGDAYEPKRVPMTGKDIAVIGAIAQDKRRLSLNLPTSIRSSQASSERMNDIARQFAELSRSFQEKNANAIDGELEDRNGE